MAKTFKNISERSRNILQNFYRDISISHFIRSLRSRSYLEFVGDDSGRVVLAELTGPLSALAEHDRRLPLTLSLRISCVLISRRLHDGAQLLELSGQWIFVVVHLQKEQNASAQVSLMCSTMCECSVLAPDIDPAVTYHVAKNVRALRQGRADHIFDVFALVCREFFLRDDVLLALLGLVRLLRRCLQHHKQQSAARYESIYISIYLYGYMS